MSDSQKKQAIVVAMRSLAVSPKSRNELAKKLKDKGYPGSIIKSALDQLESNGILNDRSYAEQLVSRFTMSRPSGQRKISFELRRKGVPDKIREDVLSELSKEDEIGRAQEIAAVRWERIKDLPPEKRKKRLFDFLNRRGFDYQTVLKVVTELEQSNEDE